MKTKLNLDWDKAEYELNYIFSNEKTKPPEFYPMRFGKKRIKQVLTAMGKSDWPTIRRLSIPPFVTKTKPQTPQNHD